MKRYLKKVFKSTDKEKIMDVKIENDIAKVFVCIDSDFNETIEEREQRKEIENG